MGLLDDKMYGKSMLATVCIHSCICSNEESSVTFQKKNLSTGTILRGALFVCVCLLAIFSNGKLMLT